MPHTPEEDALIDSFEEEHPEEHAQKAEEAAAAATPPQTPSETKKEAAAPQAPAPATPEAPPHEEIEKAKGTGTVETLPASPQPTTDALTSLQSLPLEVSVEVSRLEMNFKSLSELRPGNLLELPTRPENGVHLVVNGKKLARGELIRVGQLLGVRILEIKK